MQRALYEYSNHQSMEIFDDIVAMVERFRSVPPIFAIKYQGYTALGWAQHLGVDRSCYCIELIDASVAPLSRRAEQEMAKGEQSRR